MVRSTTLLLTASLMTVSLLTSPVVADAVWPVAVARASDDRDADVLAQLQRAGRFQEAAQICRSRLATLAMESDAAAKWSIRLSHALSSALMAESVFDDPQINAAEKPIKDLLGSYPDHSRRLFLEAQRKRVYRDAAKHSVVTASVSPATEQRNDQAMKRVAHTTADLLALAQQVRDAQSQLGSERGTRQFALIDDLVRLEQELQVDAVSLSLLQTELFSPGSQDLLAAATSAEAAAGEAAAGLPASSPARREVQRLRIEAIIRGEQFQRGEAELAEYVRTLPKPIGANVLAMQVRIEIARDRLATAEKRLASFYGTTPATAPASIEMDLARLQYLLASGGGNGRIGKWLDIIERRSGLYARRRAEAISLAGFRAGGTAGTIDPSLVAAQGQQWVLRGDHGRAGELFSAAAMAESDGQRAIRHATGAAAALMKADRIGDAARILAKVAVKNPDADAAPAAHLQAAVVYSDSDLPDAAARIEAILKTQLSTWPANGRATAAHGWLVKLLSSQHRHAEAAAAATMLPATQITSVNLDRAIDLWRIAIRSSEEVEKKSEIGQQFQESFRPLLNQPLAASYFRSAASYLLGRQRLDGLPDRRPSAGKPEDTYCDQLLAYRKAKGESALDPPPDQLRQITTWRLMQDAREFPSMRASVAAAINAWPPGSQPLESNLNQRSLERAERLIWLGQVPGAVKVLRKLVSDSSRSGSMMRQAASLLGSSDDASAKSEAIKMWDELAAGIPQGSESWHRAKLRSIELLAQTGKREEARRRAKYILLTAAPRQAELKQRYQSATK